MKVGEVMSGKSEEGDMGRGREGRGEEREREDHKGWGTGKPRTFPLKVTLQVTFTISYYPIIHLCSSLSSKEAVRQYFIQILLWSFESWLL